MVRFEDVPVDELDEWIRNVIQDAICTFAVDLGNALAQRVHHTNLSTLIWELCSYEDRRPE